MDFHLQTYYPVFLFLVVVIGFALTTLVVTHILGPRKKTEVKLMPYESGMDPIGDARQKFDVKFYQIAILFLIFDVELLFLYPWAVVAYRSYKDGTVLLPDLLGHAVFWEVIVFLVTLAVAFAYAWRKGVFR